MSRVCGSPTKSVSTARLKGSKKPHNFLLVLCKEEGARPTTPGRRWEKNRAASRRKER
jgi:hypothetical protein